MSHRFWMRFLAIALVLPALFFALAPLAGAGSGAKHVLEIGTVVPGQMGWAQRPKEFIIPFAQKISGGNLDIQVYWGGIKGDDEDILAKVRAGELQGGAFSGYGSTLVCPEFSVVGLPFLFNNFEEVDHVRREMLPTFEKLFEERGFSLFLWVDQDFDQLYSTKYPMDRLQDFRQSTFIQWYGSVEKELFRALGAPSIPAQISNVNKLINSDRANAAIGPAMWVLGTQLYPKVKYVNRLKIRYSPVAVALDSGFWKKMPPEYREKSVKEQGALLDRFLSYSRKDAERCIEAMKAYGVRETELAPDEKQQIEALARTSWDRLSGNVFPRELLQKLLGHLKEFRDRP